MPAVPPDAVNVLADVVGALRHALTKLGLSVAVGQPDATADITIWAWRLNEQPRFHSQPPPRDLQPGALGSHAGGIELHFLLVSKGNEQAITRLATAHAALMAGPMLKIDGRTATITADALPPADTAALFSAAQLPLTLSAAYVLRL